MVQLGYMKYAPEWIQKFVMRERDPFKAYAFFEIIEGVDVVKHPILRDRSEEMQKAVKGMADGKPVAFITKKGHEWKLYGFEPVGAQFAKTYRLLIA